jgi:hypothetical protein
LSTLFVDAIMNAECPNTPQLAPEPDESDPCAAGLLTFQASGDSGGGSCPTTTTNYFTT